MTGEQLRAARQALGLRQFEFGNALGLSANEIARKERGERAITHVMSLAVECLLRRAGKFE